ncbi:MAG: ABC transporter ATP-binding protein/permease [Oscillospiraceae bacterium]|nr:ABC transporter ATP-binding protein/permease [Oscillospiraceae bacterium]
MSKLLKYLKDFSGLAVLSIFLVLLHNILQLVIPMLTASMISTGIEGGNVPFIYLMGFIMLSVSLLNVVISILSSYSTSKTSAGYAMTLRKQLFTKVSSLSQSDIDKIGVPSLITRTTNDVRNVQDMVLSLMRMIITVPIMLVGGLVMALMYDKKMTLTILLIVVPLFAVMFLLMAKIFMPWFNTLQKRTDKVNQIMREKLGGIRVIRAFNRSKYEDKRFDQANLDLTAIALRVNRLMAYLMPVLVIFVFGLLIVLIGNTGNRLDGYSVEIPAELELIQNTVGNMFAFISYLIIVITAIMSAASLFVSIPKAQISAKRILEVLEIVPDIPEASSPVQPQEGVRGLLEFRDVTFGYPGADTPIVNDVSFTSRAGEVTAIIGGTGSGKSTLISLIPRMYDVSSGSILLDGADIRGLSSAMLHEHIAYIPQKAFLFSGTVADNLRYGKPDATEDEMYRALGIAQAKSFVHKMPDGLQSLISQSATNLSGGQKQRLAIARALIKDAEICIFDDSFSALDLATDARLRAAIKKDLKDRNIIIVAQRVGTVLDADRIIVLDEGRVVGMGTHSELLSFCEVYREIVVSQLSEEEAAV